MTTKQKSKFTTLDVVKETIKELGYEYDQQRGWINTQDTYNHNDPITIMASKVRHTLEQVGFDRVPATKTIIENLEMLVFEAQKQFATKCYDTVKFNPKAKDTFEDLSRLIAGDNYHEIYPHIFRQWIYTVKNRLNGRSVMCPIFPVLYGLGGIGKSTFIKKLYAPLPPHKCNLVKEGQKVVDSEKHMQMLFDNLVIHLEEMADMDKASIEKMKTILDMTYGGYVPLYTNATKRGFVTATFIGSSNTAVKNILISTDLNRKWVQVNYFTPPSENREPYIRERMAGIGDFDFLNLWQSVDEDGAEPFSDPVLYQKYKDYVEATCRSSTPTTDFLDELIHTKGGEWIAKKDLHVQYKRALQDEDKTIKPQRKDLFFETCDKRGLIPKRLAGVGTRGYDIPKTKPSDTFNIGEMAMEDAE